MKVLYIITLSEHGGSQRHVSDLIYGLCNRVSIELCTSSPGFLTEQAEKLNIRCHIIPDLVQPISFARDGAAFMKVRRLLRETNPDLVHAHTAKAGFLARAAAATTGHSVVFTPHGWSFSERSSGFRRMIALPLEKIAARWSAHTIVVSEAEHAEGLRHRIGPPDRFTVIYNGVNDVPDGSGSGGTIPTFVMVARFAPPKDHETLVCAVSEIQMPFRLQLVGDGPNRQRVQELVRQLRMESKVEFTGTRSDVASILSRAQALVLSSRSESFPISILEAMRAGIPVVATDVGGVSEAVVDGETGFLVPPRDVGALRIAIQRLTEDATLRQRLGQQGRRRFQNSFTASVMVDRTMALYRGILDRPRVQ